MYKRLINFLNKHDILNEHQYGFRKGRSTDMALIELTDKISRAIENNEYTLGIFLDLSKAFDTVNHEILLKKLNFYGIRGTALDWFERYLTNRKQTVKSNDVKSVPQTITCGVPQGSVLGPLLFLIYINDIHKSSSYFSFILFADDTNLFSSGKNLKMLCKRANIELQKVSIWLKANKLTLNVTKTQYIIFKSRKKKLNKNIDIKLDNHSNKKN